MTATKTCEECNVEQPLWEFPVLWRLGVPFPGPVCLECRGERAEYSMPTKLKPEAT